VAERIAGMLAMRDIDSVVFDGAKPNPSIANVEAGLAVLQRERCDCVVSLGGGSPHDCAKGIALCATNGGHISDYEGWTARASRNCRWWPSTPPPAPPAK
jgi:alcohol dehydrogenase